MLVAHLHAEVARVSEVGRYRQVVQGRVGQRLHQRAVLSHRALAVLVGRSGVVLADECARDGERGGQSGRHFGRRHAVVVRIVAHVLDEDIEALF